MPRGRRVQIAAALGAAAAVHALIGLAILASWPEPAVPPPDDESRASDGEITTVALAEPAPTTTPPPAVRGGADELGAAQTHPLPAQHVDLPGAQAASRGGGVRAGETAFTERRDPSHDDALRHEPWNDKAGHQSAHERTARRSASPEAIHRDDTHAIGDRARAAAGSVASSGDARGQGAGIAPRGGHDEPIAGAANPPPTPGSSRASTTAAMTDPGAHAADVVPHATTAADATNAAAASHVIAPAPFEITPASAGGRAPTGVAGTPAPGQLDGGRGAGTAAATAQVRVGARDLTVTATTQDPYFRALFAKLGAAITYPRDLALDLRSGRPVATFTLRADGAIADVEIAVPSLPGFNRELVRALVALAHLPPPPPSLLAARTSVRVRVEWAFDPGILR
jgi:hypothetical protein